MRRLANAGKFIVVGVDYRYSSSHLYYTTKFKSIVMSVTHDLQMTTQACSASGDNAVRQIYVSMLLDNNQNPKITAEQMQRHLQLNLCLS